MPVTEASKSIRKLLLHDKPFILLQIISQNDGRLYPAMISKKIDCSYAYVVKLIKLMDKIGLTTSDGNKHKKIISLTQKGKKIFKLLSEL
ncbi:MAG: hypothetical protein M1573_00285 [Candidatus Parvarchaeota archaeon]|jgi:predicted transcriptional regulator|nr:hypothetical protein [Candidatus Parvarchaeota archaeon]MCL5017669.1 hypothetical protein [Candidatus Parvarchaeota archaeon]